MIEKLEPRIEIHYLSKYSSCLLNVNETKHFSKIVLLWDILDVSSRYEIGVLR